MQQGDSTLLVTPSGKTLLVDSGKNGHGKRIKAVMDTAGVSQIDVFVATIITRTTTAGLTIWSTWACRLLPRSTVGTRSAASKRQGEDVQGLEAVGHRAEHLQRGRRLEIDPLVTITCTSSGGVVIGEDDAQHGKHENDMSVSLLVTFGGFRYFVGGDIESTTEAKIAARDLATDADVYQAITTAHTVPRPSSRA